MTLFGLIDPRLVVADRRRRDQVAVVGDAGDLDEGDVQVPEVALPHHLRDVREVHIQVVHAARH